MTKTREYFKNHFEARVLSNIFLHSIKYAIFRSIQSENVFLLFFPLLFTSVKILRGGSKIRKNHKAGKVMILI